jgi:murein DD-endopeptidase MepM/ murein hydrolase activator NlpD
VGPIEQVTAKPLGDVEKFASLSRLEPAVFSGQFSTIVNGLMTRSLAIEKNVTELYQGHQDRMIRLSSTPEIWPVKGWMTSAFGPRRHPVSRRIQFHEGMDIAAAWGQPVYATGAGVIRLAAYKGGLGKTVIIDHGYGMMSYYGHNSKLFVQPGDKVQRGDQIASVGNTGHSTGPHVHYEIHVDGIPVDPYNFLPALIEEAAVTKTSSGRL